MKKVSLAALALLPILAASEGDHFQITPKGDHFLGGNIVYKGLTKDLTADSLNQKEFKDLYIVKLPILLSVKDMLSTYGTIVQIVEHDFALMRMQESRAERLSGALHGSLGACGMVIKLDGERDLSGQLLAASKPIYSTGEILPQVLKGQGQVDLTNIKKDVSDLEAMGTRHHKSESGIKVPSFLKGRYEALAKGRPDVTIDFFKNQNSPQDNIRVRILGKTKPEEVVVIGSHIDSINQGQRGGPAPGADDNASGTATNMEIFRVIMNSGWTFDRTIEIHGYGAEEVGLYGSANMAKDYQQRNVNVVSMVQFDMNMYQSSKDLIMWFVTNDTDPSFNKELQALVTKYQKLPVSEKAVFGGTSDHRSWTSRGFKAAFPFEDASSYNQKIHTTGDTSAYSGNFPLAAEFAKLGLSYFAHYAGKI